MADRSIVEILLRARGGKQVAGETRQASGALNRLDRSAKTAHGSIGKLGTGMRSVGRASLYAGGAIATGLVIEVKRGTQAWEEHRKITADTARVIKTTGGVANVSAKHVDRLANSIQAKTAVDDDQVAAGQNVLLSFLRVRNEAGKGNRVFDRATKLAVDMSKRFGTDTKGAFVQLGKALDDPIKGITALRRSGVSFTAAERDKIKALEESGHHLEAQKMILAALDKQVGGSARAQRTSIGSLKQSWGDFEKELGHQLAPTVDTVTRKLGHMTDDAARIFGRKDLTLAAKVKLFNRKDLEPAAKDLVAGLKAANLDDKLQGAIEWAAPKMATGFAHAAPKVASTFLHAWLNADAWGKLLTAGVLAKKMGAFGGVIRLLSGGGKGLPGLAASAAPVKVWVVNNGPGGDSKGSLRKFAEKFGPYAAPAAAAGASVFGPAAAIYGLGKLGAMSYHPIEVKEFTGDRKLFGPRPEDILKPHGPTNPAAGPRGQTPWRGVAGAPLRAVADPRLLGYPDSHQTAYVYGRAIAAGVRPLERLPDKVAGAVARRPQNINVTVTPQPVILDGVQIGEVLAGHTLKYKERG